VRHRIEVILQKNELNGAVYDDLVHLKDIYMRYQDQLHRRKHGTS
jgi:hypothetical protein